MFFSSVVGLNFDFLALNLVGFTLYGLFNCGLYWIPEVEVRSGSFICQIIVNFANYSCIVVKSNN